MSVTFQKRQKEMKRQEKQRAKAEKRAQKKEARRAAKEADTAAPADLSTSTEPQLQPRDDFAAPDGKIASGGQ
jgi:hypothetical protein